MQSVSGPRESGYAETSLTRAETLESNLRILTAPFTVEALTNKISEALGQVTDLTPRRAPLSPEQIACFGFTATVSATVQMRRIGRRH